MKKFGVGLVVGKFCPLTHGHEYLIETAAANCEKLVVLSYTSSNFHGCDPEERRWWLKHYFGREEHIQIHVLDHNAMMPEDDAPGDWHRDFCAGWLLDNLHTTVDAVFSSEEYGDGFAAYLTKWYRDQGVGNHEVQHVCVDIERKTIPVSGTRARAGDPEALKHVSPLVRSSLKKRIAILGGESSGKTVLAQALAEKLGTVWIPEYGRTVCEIRGGVDNLRYQDMVYIAEQQVMCERVNGVRAKDYIICDTTPLATLWYARNMFMGPTNPRLEKLADRRYDMTFICANDFPFVQDGTRESAAFRLEAFRWYCDRLDRSDIPYHVVMGSVEERVDVIMEHLKCLG